MRRATAGPWSSNRMAGTPNPNERAVWGGPRMNTVVGIVIAEEPERRLMVAAPELLAACEVALSNLAPLYSSDHLVMKSLRAAIAKAKGAA